MPSSRTNSERQKRHRDRLKAAGLKQVHVWVPVEFVPELREAAEKACDDFLTQQAREKAHDRRQGALPLLEGPAND